jgi:antitoxin component of MazEF toxin-antitoxin module
MKEYLQIHKNGEVTLPPAICRAAKLQEGNLLEAAVEEDGSIRLIPKSGEVQKLMEQSQLKDINWASKQKREAKK